MREAGLRQAIEAAGGVRALARLLGVSQPTVSGWRRVPADRVLAVEALTGIDRTVLRPDLYPPQDAADDADIDPVDWARAEEYALLAALLWRAPAQDLLDRLSRLRGDASEIGMAHLALAEAAAGTDAEAVSREFFDLFIGLGRGELLPYASYYLTGFLHERPLAVLRGDLARLGIERAERVAEPEDHIAILCETMAGLIRCEFGVAGLGEREFFLRHMEPWAARFFADLETSRAGRFYRAVGTLGRVMMEIEAEAFPLPA